MVLPTRKHSHTGVLVTPTRSPREPHLLVRPLSVRRTCTLAPPSRACSTHGLHLHEAVVFAPSLGRRGLTFDTSSPTFTALDSVRLRYTRSSIVPLPFVSPSFGPPSRDCVYSRAVSLSSFSSSLCTPFFHRCIPCSSFTRSAHGFTFSFGAFGSPFRTLQMSGVYP